MNISDRKRERWQNSRERLLAVKLDNYRWIGIYFTGVESKIVRNWYGSHGNVPWDWHTYT